MASDSNLSFEALCDLYDSKSVESDWEPWSLSEQQIYKIRLGKELEGRFPPKYEGKYGGKIQILEYMDYENRGNNDPHTMKFRVPSRPSSFTLSVTFHPSRYGQSTCALCGTEDHNIDFWNPACCACEKCGSSDVIDAPLIKKGYMKIAIISDKGTFHSTHSDPKEAINSFDSSSVRWLITFAVWAYVMQL